MKLNKAFALAAALLLCAMMRVWADTAGTVRSMTDGKRKDMSYSFSCGLVMKYREEEKKGATHDRREHADDKRYQYIPDPTSDDDFVVQDYEIDHWYVYSVTAGTTVKFSCNSRYGDVGITAKGGGRTLKSAAGRGAAEISYTVPQKGLSSFTVEMFMSGGTPFVSINCDVSPRNSCDGPKVDSKIRFNDFYGEVKICPDCEEDDAYEFAELNTIIYEDDRIRTEEDSGAILGLRAP